VDKLYQIISDNLRVSALMRNFLIKFEISDKWINGTDKRIICLLFKKGDSNV